MEQCLSIISDTVWFTPLLFVIVAMTALGWEVLRRKSRTLVYEAVPRAPGESIRSELDGMNEKMIFRLIITLVVAVLSGVAARAVASSANYPLVHAVMFTGSGIALAFTLWTWKLLIRWRNARLGLEAERGVGRELDLLMLDGCRVFHDLVDKRIGNLDHIIVAAHALFVVETDTTRKPVPGAVGPDRRVSFNGKELRYPGYTTNVSVKKAGRNAKWLAKYVEKATGLDLPVYPILTLPGWTVESTGNGPVTVLNVKEVGSVVTDRAATPLYAAQRQRVINLLDAQCRSGSA